MTTQSIAKRISFIGLGQFINAIVNILLVPYLARALEPEVYGSYGQVLLVIGILEVVFSFGLSKLVFNYLNKKVNSLEDSLLNILLATFFLSVLGVLFVFAFAKPIASFMNNDTLSFYLSLYIFSLPLNLAAKVFISVLNHYNSVKWISLLNVLNNLLRVAIIIVAIHVFNSLELIFIGLVALSILYFFVLQWKCPIKYSQGKWNLRLFTTFLKEGLPLSLSGVTSMLLVQTDGIMISNMLETTDYAIYRMGAIPVPFLFLVFSSVITVTMPAVTKLFYQGKIQELLLLKRNASLMIASLTYPILIFILVFSKDLLLLYLGENYQASTPVFIIYNLLLFLRINDYRDVLIAKGKTRVILYADLFIFGLNFILNYFLIISFGVAGAAIASIISYYSLSFILFTITKNYLNEKTTSFFDLKRLLSIAVLSLLFAVLVYQVYVWADNVIVLLPLLIVYLLASYYSLIKLKIMELNSLLNMIATINMLKPIHFLLSKIK